MRRTKQSSLFTLLLGSLLFSWMAGNSIASDASGVWKGRWTAHATQARREHGGPLRVRLKPLSNQTYQGTFSGRFAVIIPYFYRATVYQRGNNLYSSKRLGPSGQYDMMLHAGSSGLNGQWTAMGKTGSIELRKQSSK